MATATLHIPASIAALPREASGFDVDSYGEKELRQLLHYVRTAERSLSGLTMKINARADSLAAKGESASCDEVLLGQGEVLAATARRDALRAQTAAAMPGLSDAVLNGATSGEHVDSVARYVKKLTDEEKQHLDTASVVAAASQLPADSFNRHMKKTVDTIKKDYGLSTTVAKQKASEFKHWFDKNSGMGKFSGQLDPQRYEAFAAAIDKHTNSLAQAGDEKLTKNANLAAAALFELVTSSSRTRRNQPHVSVVVDQETLETGCHENSTRQTQMGEELPPESISRLCCDATLQKVVLDNKGTPISVGRKYRTATETQWTAIASIYSHCAWHNCDRRLSWCQLHHIDEWENGGATDLDNLVPLCSRHHHLVHEGKWKVHLKPDRQLEIIKPNGDHHLTTSVPTRRHPQHPT